MIFTLELNKKFIGIFSRNFGQILIGESPKEIRN